MDVFCIYRAPYFPHFVTLVGSANSSKLHIISFGGPTRFYAIRTVVLVCACSFKHSRFCTNALCTSLYVIFLVAAPVPCTRVAAAPVLTEHQTNHARTKRCSRISAPRLRSGFPREINRAMVKAKAPCPFEPRRGGRFGSSTASPAGKIQTSPQPSTRKRNGKRNSSL